MGRKLKSMRRMNKRNELVVIALCVIVLFGAGLSCSKSDNPPIEIIEPVEETTFTNPLITGADPFVFKDGDTYYYMHTVGNALRLWETEAIEDLASATSKEVFRPTAGTPNSRNIWAPEIFKLDGKWYIYYTAGDGDDINQRTWVLENSNNDPMQGTWEDKGKIYSDQADFWAIDGTVMEHGGKRYFLWSGRPDKTNTDLTQKIYISEMTNPWTLTGDVTLLTEPEYGWERNGFGVNEAPEVLKGPDTYFMVYSASFCGTDDYALGMLTLKENGNPLVASDWIKSDQPVFTKKPSANAFGPGHNSFFKSPDGSEDWLIYHANPNSGMGCSGSRTVRMQSFTFDSNGKPNFGEPVATGLEIDQPAQN